MRRTFTLDGQHRFAALSGDRNPLHVDPPVARRLLYGRPVVHGIHLLLWALDGLLAAGDITAGLGIAVRDGDTARIDTFLMSCRVLGRRVEDVLLAELLRRVASRRSGASPSRLIPRHRQERPGGALLRRARLRRHRRDRTSSRLGGGGGTGGRPRFHRSEQERPVITTQYGDSSSDMTRPDTQLKYIEVRIGRGCRITSGSVVMPGTVLGDGCIVAPNSVAFGTWGNGVTLSGNPARPVKSKFSK